MNWRHETWRRLYVREEGSFAALSYSARALGAMLLKLCDRRGCIFARPGEVVEEAVCFRLSADKGERRMIRRALGELLIDGYVLRVDGHLRIRNFGRANGGDQLAAMGTPSVNEQDAMGTRTGREPDTNGTRTGIEECVKPAESPRTPSVVPSVPDLPSVPTVPESTDQRAQPARAIADLVAQAWPVPEPEQVAYHHAVVRVNPSASQRDPPEHRALRLLMLFGHVRAQVAAARGHPDVIAWHPDRSAHEKAVTFVRQVAADLQACRDVEPAMRLRLEDAWDSQDSRDDDPGWVFATWISRFTALRQRHHGLARAPALAGLSDKERKNLAHAQLWLSQTDGREVNR